MEHKKDGADVDAAPAAAAAADAIQATPERSNPKADEGVPGQLYSCHQYRTPTTARLQCLGDTASLSGHLSRTPHGGFSGSSPGHRQVARLRTPASAGSARRGLLTPRPLSSRGQLTPQQQQSFAVYNPFESPSMGQLQDPVFSPNMFTEMASVEKTPETFRWSIGQMAVLKPVNIDEQEIEAQYQHCKHNPELEQKAQEAINQYFSRQDVIVQSPWSESVRRRPFQELPRTPGVHSANSPMVLQVKPPADHQELVFCSDAVSQTDLSLPKDFDLQKILGDYYSKDSKHEAEVHPPLVLQFPGEEDAGSDALSTSSLRRKLFGQAGLRAPGTPTKSFADLVMHAEEMDHQVSPQVSPTRCQQSTPNARAPPSAVFPLEDALGSGHFSSSPIRGSVNPGHLHFMTPALRRCSTAPDLAETPDFSPIETCLKGGQSKESQMQGGFTPLLQATPQSCGPRKIFSSPGMSPIVVTDGSFIGHSPESICGSARKLGSGSSGRIPVSEELKLLGASPLTGRTRRRSKSRDDFLGDDSIQHMDLDDDDPSMDAGSGLNDSRVDLSLAEDPDDLEDSVSQGHTQDTGYQTSSLQSTDALGPSNMTSSDTGLSLQHTNLTVQFSHLCEEGESDGRTVIPRKVTSLIPSAGYLRSSQTVTLRDPGVRDRPVQVASFRDSALLQPRMVSGTAVPVFPWQPGTTDPLPGIRRPSETKSALIKEKITGEDSGKGDVLPASEVARLALLRAGEDYDKFCIQKMYSRYDSPLKTGLAYDSMKDDSDL